jgi:membrane-bound lytic murein transglycosylase D
VAPRFGIALADLLRANGLNGKIRLAVGSTVLVPAGKGADNLDSMGTEPRLPQIVEPEPAAKAPVAAATSARSGKPEKSVKGKAADSKLVAKDAKKGGKLAAADTAKVAKAAAGEKVKTAATKPATLAQGTKVAKSGNGRRS